MNESLFNVSLNESESSLSNNSWLEVNESSEFIFSEFKTDIVSSLEFVPSFENFMSLFLMFLFVFLTYRIFNESKKINFNIGSISLEAFSKSFKFYCVVAFTGLIYHFLVILNLYFNSELFINIYFYLLIFIFFIFIISAWAGRAYLLYSVSYKYYDEKFSLKFNKKTFLFINFVLILIDFIFGIFLAFFSEYSYIFYNIFVMLIFLFFAFKKIGLNNLSKHLPYLTIVLLLILRFTSSFEILVSSESGYNTFELFLNILTAFIYFYIFYKLISWRKRFEK